MGAWKPRLSTSTSKRRSSRCVRSPPHPDRLPGFPLAAAQVRTGRDAKDKSLKGHLGAFRSRWFRRQPVTEFVAYMIVPFAWADEKFVDNVRVMGNVLHRLRVPRRVAEARRLVEEGMTVEGYERLPEAVRWVTGLPAQSGDAGMRHRFHSICPYFAMFPEAFVEKHLAASPHEGVVFDPFCGRGTTVFQALLQGRDAAGCDLNPVAACISAPNARHPSGPKPRRGSTICAGSSASRTMERGKETSGVLRTLLPSRHAAAGSLPQVGA